MVFIYVMVYFLLAICLFVYRHIHAWFRKLITVHFSRTLIHPPSLSVLKSQQQDLQRHIIKFVKNILDLTKEDIATKFYFKGSSSLFKSLLLCCIELLSLYLLSNSRSKPYKKVNRDSKWYLPLSITFKININGSFRGKLGAIGVGDIGHYCQENGVSTLH